MAKLREIISKLYMRTVVALFCTIISVLAVISIVFSSSLRESEQTVFLMDQPLIHVAVFLAIMILGRYFSKKTRSKKRIDQLVVLTGIGCIVLCIIFVFVTWCKPVADQRSVLLIAKQMKEQDFSAFQKGGYVYIYPNQIGIILLYYLLSFIIGDYNYIALQLINIAALALSYYYLAMLSTLLFVEKRLFYKTLSGCMLFLPLAFYICFVYGNLIGLALSTGAVYYQCMYLKGREKKDIVLASVMIGGAVLLKSNYLITLVAMVIVLFMDTIMKRARRSLLGIVVIVLVYLGLQIGTQTCIEAITGEKVSDGVPKLAWVAMGLQEGSRASGWYNGYNKEVYVHNDFDAHKANEESKKAIQQSLKEFLSNKKEGVCFFTRKVASQWNNPTFQSLWILRNKEGVSHGGASIVLTGFMNIYQTVVLAGTCLYLWYYRGRRQSEELVLMLIFIGGFLFHLVWEAKAQYTITYFVLLIPYAVRGYDTILLRKIID